MIVNSEQTIIVTGMGQYKAVALLADFFYFCVKPCFAAHK